MDTPRSAHLLALAGALLAMVAAITGLWGGFVIDDKSYVVENKSVLGERSIFSEPTPPTLRDVDGNEVSGRWLGLYRPLTVASWRVNRIVSGADPFPYHLTNALIHGLVTFLAGILAWRWSQRRAVVAWTVTLFAVHPIHVEAVAWISGRAELLSAAFSIGCILVFGGPGDRRSLHRSFGAALLYAAAALSKETALPLPALLLLLDRTAGASWSAALRRVVPSAIAMALVVVARLLVLGRFGPDVSGDAFLGPLSFVERAGLGLSVIGTAASKLLVPFDLALYYPPAPFLEGTAVLLGVVALIGLIGWTVRAARRSRVALPGLCLLMVASLPFLHLIPIGAVFGDRFWYLPSVGFLYAVAVSIERAPGAPGKIARGIACVFAIACLTTTLMRNPVFKEERTIWEEVLDRSPQSGLAAYEIGRALEERGLMEYQSEERKGALHFYRRSIEVEPRHLYAAYAHLKLGDYAASQLHDAAAAEHHYRAMLEVDPSSIDGRIRIAMLLPSGLVRPEEALEMIDAALRLLRPSDPRREVAQDLRAQIQEHMTPRDSMAPAPHDGDG